MSRTAATTASPSLPSATDGKVTLVQNAPANVKVPRGFAISPDGGWLVAAGQNDNSLASHKIDPATGKLTPAAQVSGAPPSASSSPCRGNSPAKPRKPASSSVDLRTPARSPRRNRITTHLFDEGIAAGIPPAGTGAASLAGMRFLPVFIFLVACVCAGQETSAGGLPEVAFEKLSDRTLTALGKKALHSPRQ